MISIIIRAKNEMPWIKYTLRMLRQQSRQDFEVVAVDSGSTDGSFEELLEWKPQVLYQIKPEDYIPGKVLNEAIQKTKGDIIVFNNADCIPENRDWLANLVAPLKSGEESPVATFGRQNPRAKAYPLVRKDYERAFGDGSEHRKWRHFFSLASSAVKRELILRHPFREDIQYSEDIEWSWRMKILGNQIQYVPEAEVEHSHNYNFKGLAKRFFGEGKAEAAIYEDYYQSHPQERSRDYSYFRSVLLSALAESFRDVHYLLLKGRLGWIPVAPIYRFIQRNYVFRGRTATGRIN